MQRRPFVLLLTVAACLLFSVVGMNAARPFVLASRLRARNDGLERQLKRLQIQNQNAAKELRAIETPEGIELAARKLGYVFPNERKLRIPNTPANSPASNSSASTPSQTPNP